MSIDGKNLTFLLVDDEADILEILSIHLEQSFEGCSIKLANSAVEGLEILKSGFRPTMVITDQSMPDMSGVAFAKEILRLKYNTITVLYSGYVDLLDMSDGVDLCFQGILEKPSGQEEIKNTLQEILLLDESIDRQYIEYRLSNIHDKAKVPFDIYVNFGNQYVPLFKANIPVDPNKVQKIMDRPEIKCFVKTEDYVRFSDSSYKIFPINLIIPGVTLPFSVYLKMGDDYKRVIPIGVAPKEDHFKIFERHKISSFYLDDAEEYYLHQYIESNFEKLLKSKTVSDEEKGRILFERGYYLIKKLLSSVNGGNLRALKRLCSVIELVYKIAPDALFHSLNSDKEHDVAKHSFHVGITNFMIYNLILKMQPISKYANDVKSFEKTVFAGKDINTILLMSGFIHDIGMSKYVRYFQRNFDEMSEEELSQYYEHVDAGLLRLGKETEVSMKTLEVVSHHEEFCDGTGYKKLFRNKLPIMSQIISLSNSFDVKVKQGARRRDAIVEIQMAGDKFNQALVNILRRTVLPKDVK